MKKLLSILIAAILLLSLSMTCYAAEATLNDEKNQQEIDVYARYIVADTNEFTAPVENGKSEVKLPDGTTITVSGVMGDSLTFVIMPIPNSETEAWEWFSACLSDKGEVIQPYDIYFVDSHGNRINADGVKITITLPNGYSSQIVCSVTTSGSAAELDCVVENRNISFTANGSHYYVVASGKSSRPVQPDEPSQPNDSEDNVKPDDSTDGSKSDEPKTGEAGYWWLWIAVIISGMAMVCVLIIWRKKNKN